MGSKFVSGGGSTIPQTQVRVISVWCLVVVGSPRGDLLGPCMEGGAEKEAPEVSGCWE